MNIKLKKAIKDLSVNPKRTFLVIFALVLGVWGAGTVLVSYSILSKDLNDNYQGTSPLHAALYSPDFEKTDLGKIAENHQIESAEFRDFTLGRIEIEPNVWIPLWLYGVTDFTDFQLAKVFHEEGAKTPKEGTLLIERDSRKISDINTGSNVKIRIGNDIKSVPVSGIAFDPAQAPAKQDMFIYAYTDQNTFNQITGLPVDKRLIVRFKNVESAEDVERATNRLSDELKKSGIIVSEIEIPVFNEHPHQWQLNTLLFLIGSIGLLAFVMGAVLVTQLMKSIMASQIRQVGVMKAIGASRFKVFEVYVSMLLIIGIAAGIIAIPLAVMTGKAFNGFVAGQLNFNILTTSVPVIVYIVLIVSSLLLPVLLSMPALLKGTRISVKEALNDYGISTNTETGKPILSKAIKLPELTLLAIRNSQRNMKRLSVTILTMALGVAIFSTGFNVRQSLWNLLSGYDEELKYDIQIALKNPVPENEVVPLFAGLPNLKSTESWVGGQSEGKIKMIASDKGAVVVAMPYDTEKMKLNIVKASPLTVSEQFDVVMNTSAWMLYGKPSVGSNVNISIDGKSVPAVLSGIAKQYEKPRLYFDLEQYNKRFNPDGLVNTLVFTASDNQYNKVLEMKKNIEQVLASSDLDVSYVMSQAERVKIIYDHLNIILSTIVLLSFLVLVVSAIGMASATGISIMERTREIGIMRAIGATPKKIYTLFVNEGAITSVLSIILGLMLAYPLSMVASSFFGRLMLGEDATLEYAFSHLGFVVTLIITLSFGWIASKVPARSAIKISTYKALSYE